MELPLGHKIIINEDCIALHNSFLGDPPRYPRHFGGSTLPSKPSPFWRVLKLQQLTSTVEKIFTPVRNLNKQDYITIPTLF